MKRAVLLLTAVWCAAWMASCGADGSTNPGQHSASNAFAVTLENGSGSFTPQVSVSNDAAGPVVTVSTTDAHNLTTAYLHLSYDSSKYTPSKVDFGSMLGQGDQVLTLALTNRAADVPVGICQVPSSGVAPASGSGTLAVVHFTATPFAGRSVSNADPTSGVNKVGDLSIIGQDTQSVTLRWTEVHPGDTDNNGEANLADMTNIGKYLNKTVADQADPLAVGMADTDGNGEVNAADLTNLGRNLGTVVSGYTLYTDAAGTQTYGNGQVIARANFYNPDDPASKNHPVIYTFSALVSGGSSPTFSVAPVNAADQTAPGPQSNAAASVVVDGPPDAPSNFAATGSQAIGSGKVRLTWVPSTAGDVVGYDIQRKTVSPDGPFTSIVTVPGKDAASYVDSDPALTGQAYGYQIRAVDVTSLYSDFSAEADATPYILPGPSAPTNFTAVTSVSAGQAVDLAWAAPSDASAAKFRIYREGPGESSFTMIKQTQNAVVSSLTDANLTALTNYQYYVTSVGATNVESSPTATLTAKSSEQAAINITNVTVDKLTHLKSGSEAAANIVVSTDAPADSFQCSGAGVFTANATGGTWKPDAQTPVGKTALMITAVKGPTSSAPYEVDVYVTSEPIKTQFGNSGKYLDDINVGGSSPQIPSFQAPTAPYRPLDYYVNKDHVVFYNSWGIWCYYCKLELPDIQKFQTYYGTDGFQYVGEDDQTQAVEPVSAIKSFYQSNSYTGFESYAGQDPAFLTKYGFQNAWPTSILIDRDGMIRLQIVGAIEGTNLTKWNTVISELTGKTPALSNP